MNSRLHRLVYITLILSFVLLLTPSVTHPQEQTQPAPTGLRPDAPPYALHGPYWVGTRLFAAETASHPTQIQVWYPALNPDGTEESVQYPHDYWPDYGVLPVFGKSLQDAEPNAAAAPYPLVIFAHGMNAGRYQSAYLMEHLASYGLIVMSMDYIDNLGTAGKVPFEAIFYTRTQDISWQIDYAATELNGSSGAFKDAIDLEHIAAIGVSQGGTALLNASGAPFDFASFRSACEQDTATGQLPMGLGGGNLCTEQAGLVQSIESGMTMLAGLKTTPTALWPSWAEARLDAAVYLAPTSIWFGEESLKAVTIPALLIGGSADHGVVGPPDTNFTRAYAALGSASKSQVMLQDAGHTVYNGACSMAPWLVQAGFFGECSDPVWDMDRAHDLINHFTTAFLLDVLKGDTAAHAALAPDAVSFPGITYQAEGF